MSRTRHASLFTIVGEENGRIITADGIPFDSVTYSRFKYGDMRAAAYYGEMLVEEVKKCSSFRARPSNVTITASAYKELPTAAQAVATAVTRRLQATGYLVQSGRIHRTKLTEGDYGNMSADERAYWMSCNGLWVDEKEFRGRDVLVIDDISISGAHGRSIIEMFSSVELKSLTLVHVLTLSPELATLDPKIEDRMNHAVIKNLVDLRRLIADCPGYTPNARTIKFILSQPVDEITLFLSDLSYSLVKAINASVKADEYDRMRCYKSSAQAVAYAHNQLLLTV